MEKTNQMPEWCRRLLQDLHSLRDAQKAWVAKENDTNRRKAIGKEGRVDELLKIALKNSLYQVPGSREPKTAERIAPLWFQQLLQDAHAMRDAQREYFQQPGNRVRRNAMSQKETRFDEQLRQALARGHYEAPATNHVEQNSLF